MLKIIKDIRYYSCKYPIASWKSFPSNLSELYDAPKNYAYIGQRFVLKLRELNFFLEDFDHVYINLTPLIKLDESHLLKRVDIYHKWFRYIDYGYPIEKMSGLSADEKIKEIHRITMNALIKNLCDNNDDIKKVKKVYEQLKKTGELTDIVYRTLKVRKYNVDFILHILDNGKVDVFADCEELKNDRIFVKKLDSMSIVNCALGSIKINDNILTIIPRKNFDSEYYKLKEIEVEI